MRSMRVVGVLNGIGIAGVIGIGVMHTASAPFFFRAPSVDAVWFAGSGLTLVFVGFLNLVVRRHPSPDAVVRVARGIANALTVWLGGFAVSQLGDIVSVVVLSTASLLAVGGVLDDLAHLQRTT